MNLHFPMRRPSHALVRRLALVAALAGSAAAQAQTAPTVEGAWARPTVAGQAAGGGFLTIRGGATADRLVAASSPAAKGVELHTMDMDGNVMRMRQVPAIDVPAGQTVALKPGATHLMFTGLTQPLKAGEAVPVVLRFEKAGPVTVEMKVMTQPMADDGHAMHKH